MKCPCSVCPRLPCSECVSDTWGSSELHGGGPSPGVVWSGWYGWLPSFLLPSPKWHESVEKQQQREEWEWRSSSLGLAAPAGVAASGPRPFGSCREVQPQTRPCTEFLGIHSILITSLGFSGALKISRVVILKLIPKLVNQLVNFLNIRYMVYNVWYLLKLFGLRCELKTRV